VKGEREAFLRRNYFFDKEGEASALRYGELFRKFRLKHETEEILYARAPGRINLIGEHTDYNGCPVFPMAVNKDIVAVFSPLDKPILEVEDAGDNDYGSRSFTLEEDIPPYSSGDWGNYPKAAAQGIVDYLKGEVSSLKGARMLITSIIPPAAGMSSSSAFVVLTAVVLLRVNNIDIPPLELASLLARAEHYVGTQGGGMDQAVSLMGRAGYALKMDFNPLAIHPVSLPREYVFVVANSMVAAKKTGTAMNNYNRRAIECRLATAVLNREFSREAGKDMAVRLIGDLTEDRLGMNRDKIKTRAEAFLAEKTYSLKEIALRLEKSPQEVEQAYCLTRDGSVFGEPEDGYKLGQRLRHVISEWHRVEASAAAIEKGKMSRFGELMNESHASCRDDYEISCPELDRLVSIAGEAGALGSRLTGAGFGGCTVSLVERDRVEGFIDELAMKYYRDVRSMDTSSLSEILFPCKAVDGAGVLPSFQ
jgi:N-acetylgalactosamine kinase